MPPVTRLGDVCTGHASWPPRPNTSASPNVFVNSIAVHRKGDSWAVHCNHQPVCHASVLASGSGTVFTNNIDTARIGDPVACGSSVAQGSPNVFAGG